MIALRFMIILILKSPITTYSKSSSSPLLGTRASKLQKNNLGKGAGYSIAS